MHMINFLCLFSLMSVQSNMLTLDDLRWEKRIVVTFSNDQKINETLEDELKDSNHEINDRDIIYFLISPTTTLSNSESYLSLEDLGYLIHEHFNNEDQFKVILIGKDGGVKMEKNNFDLQYIFQLIDSMPIRQREMKAK